MKHIKQHPYLGALYLIILISFTVALFDEQTGVAIGAVCIAFLFLFSYFDLTSSTKADKLIIDMRDKEIADNKKMLEVTEKQSNFWHESYKKVQQYSRMTDNQLINLKAENEKLLQTIKDLENNPIIADQEDIPPVHFSRANDYLNQKEAEK